MAHWIWARERRNFSYANSRTSRSSVFFSQPRISNWTIYFIHCALYWLHPGPEEHWRLKGGLDTPTRPSRASRPRVLSPRFRAPRQPHSQLPYIVIPICPKTSSPLCLTSMPLKWNDNLRFGERFEKFTWNLRAIRRLVCLENFANCTAYVVSTC